MLPSRAALLARRRGARRRGAAVGRRSRRAPATPYFEFLMARRLEVRATPRRAGRAERAAAADPASAEIRAEIAAFQLRQQPARRGREGGARGAGARRGERRGAPRPRPDLCRRRRRRQRAARRRRSLPTFAREAITHLERRRGDARRADIKLHYTLGRLYLRSGDAEKAVAGARPRRQPEPELRAGPAVAGAGLRRQPTISRPRSTRSTRSSTTSRASPRRWRSTWSRRASRRKRPRPTPARSRWQPMSRELKFRRIAALFAAKDFAGAADVCRRGAGAASRGPALPAAAGARAVRRRATRRARCGARAGARRRSRRTRRRSSRWPTCTTTPAAIPTPSAPSGSCSQIEPANADALNYLGYLLADRGEQLDEAIRLVRARARRRPGQPVVSRQPRLGLLPPRRPRRGREVPGAGRREAAAQLGRSRITSATATRAAAAGRSDRRLDAGARRRRRRLDRAGDREEDRGRRSKLPR